MAETFPRKVEDDTDFIPAQDENDLVTAGFDVTALDRFYSVDQFLAMPTEKQKRYIEYFTETSDVLKKFFLTREREEELVGEAGAQTHKSEILGKVIVVSGPSGVGKDTAIARLLASNPDIQKVVTATSRDARPGEENGVAYHFITREMFRFLLQGKLFVDMVEYANNHYGMPMAELERRTQSEAIIINAVPETAQLVKQLVPDAKAIFILPPSEEAQRDRLQERGTESDEVILQRIQADQEMFGAYADVPDYTIISEDGESGIDAVVEQLEQITR